MLVLSRHRDEQVMIGNDIVLTIVEIRGDKVRLGIQAPANIPVHRREIFEAIQKQIATQPAEAATDVKAKTLAEYVEREKHAG